MFEQMFLGLQHWLTYGFAKTFKISESDPNEAV